MRRDGLFWAVRAERATAYLLGTIHVGRPDFYPLAPRIEAAFADSETLVLELDMSRRGRRELVFALLSEIRLEPGDSLDRYVSAPTLRKLREFFTRHDLANDRIMQLRPWAVALVVMMLEAKHGGPTVPGVDPYLAAKAQGKKGILGLESSKNLLHRGRCGTSGRPRQRRRAAAPSRITRRTPVKTHSAGLGTERRATAPPVRAEERFSTACSLDEDSANANGRPIRGSRGNTRMAARPTAKQQNGITSAATVRRRMVDMMYLTESSEGADSCGCHRAGKAMRRVQWVAQ